MKGIGLLQLLILGQVVPGGSPLQRLDPRTRMVGLVLLVLGWLVVGQTRVAFLALLVTALLVLLARLPADLALRSVGVMLPWLVLLAVFQLLFRMGDRPGCAVLVEWSLVRISTCTLETALVAVMRFVGLLLLIGLFTWTTPIPDLAHGLESLAGPFDRLGLPAHELAMVGVIAVRFVPTLALEAERLDKAQRARGSELTARRSSLVDRIRRTLPKLVPLLILALRRAERLAEAMEARAYQGGKGRGQYARLRLGWPDWLALSCLCVWLGVLVYLGV